jgi:hypothetical protein
MIHLAAHTPLIAPDTFLEDQNRQCNFGLLNPVLGPLGGEHLEWHGGVAPIL